MSITQKDIAAKLGVSQRLVSYALNGRKGVGEKMRRRILQTAEELGYTPNHVARALVTGRTHQIALWFQFSTTFNHEMSHHFQKLATRSAYDLLSISSRGQVRQTGSIAVDGGIFYGSISPQLVTPFPVVEILMDLRGKSAGEPPRDDLIVIHMEEASRTALRHLLTQGCTRIAYVSIPAMMGNYDPRHRAYTSELQKVGLSLERIFLETPDDGNYRNEAQAVLHKYFYAHGFPDALICSNDDIAIGAYRVLREAGKRIPEDVAVIGCDDIEESKDHIPALTSIQFPCEEICKSAWEMLTTRIENPELPPRTKTFSARLIIRQSAMRKSTFAA